LSEKFTKCIFDNNFKCLLCKELIQTAENVYI